jgi:hypothetical protein
MCKENLTPQKWLAKEQVELDMLDMKPQEGTS